MVGLKEGNAGLLQVLGGSGSAASRDRSRADWCRSLVTLAETAAGYVFNPIKSGEYFSLARSISAQEMVVFL